MEQTETTIEIKYNHHSEMVTCKVDYGASMRFEISGLIDFGQPNLITREQLHLRDYIQSVFCLTDLFLICKAQYDYEQLKTKSRIKDRTIKRLKKETGGE